MCNSGSSALYLAVELLGCEPGDEIDHLGGHVLDRHRAARACRARARVRRRRARHLQHRRRRHRGDDRAAHQGDPRAQPHRQRARLGPHPRHRRPPRAQGDRGLVRRARRHAARARPPARAPTSASRASRSSHIITAAGTGGMVLLDDDELVDRCLLLRRWGRRSEPQLFGIEEGRPALLLRRSTASSTTTSSSSTRWAGTSSRRELCAAFGLVQLRKLPDEPRAAPAQLRPAVARSSARTPTCSRCRATLEGSRPAGTCSRSCSGPSRASGAAEFQEHMEAHGVDTRMVWTGNVTRQPAFAKVAAPRARRRAARTPTG